MRAEGVLAASVARNVAQSTAGACSANESVGRAPRHRFMLFLHFRAHDYIVHDAIAYSYKSEQVVDVESGVAFPINVGFVECEKYLSFHVEYLDRLVRPNLRAVAYPICIIVQDVHAE